MKEMTDEELIRTGKMVLEQPPYPVREGQFYTFFDEEWYSITPKQAIKKCTEIDKQWIQDLYPELKNKEKKMNKIKTLATANKKPLIIGAAIVGVIGAAILIKKYVPATAIVEIAPVD